MKLAFAASDETIRRITADGFRALARDRGDNPGVVLTEIDPRDPGVIGARAAVLLDIPDDQIARFGRPETYENGSRVFEVPVSFVERFPIIASRPAPPAVEPEEAAEPAPAEPAQPEQAGPEAPAVGARRLHRDEAKATSAGIGSDKDSPLPDGVMALLPGLALVLVTLAMYGVAGGDEEGPREGAGAEAAPARSAEPAERPEEPERSGQEERAREREAEDREAARRETGRRERVRRLAARSRPVGSPTDGRLAGGVPVPAEGRSFFTWNIPDAKSPNPRFRRHGTYAVVQRVLRVADEYRKAHPRAARVGIADLSLPRGGEFGVEYGGSGHVGHRNGTEVDILYPRRDRKEAAVDDLGQVDRRLSQDLLDRFVRAGAVLVEVDGRLGLRAPAGKIKPASFHEEHMHVRFPR